MNIYLAGVTSAGNLAKVWKDLADRGGQMKVHLAGAMSRPYVMTGDVDTKKMNSPEFPMNCINTIHRGQKILESFYYCRTNEWFPKLLPYFSDFLLDSGAFTFIQGVGTADWDSYTEDYANWINRYKIEKFFELDIDSIVGLKVVERLRRKLETLTGRQPIPVWHISRGWDYFVGMCKEYPYVAFGGLHTDGVSKDKLERAFPAFINTAHKHGAKIHGLGYTSLEGIKKYHFDSVDSTAWLYGNRGGYLYKFNPRTGVMEKQQVPKGYRLKSTEAAIHNYTEWTKFQRYAERYL